MQPSNVRFPPIPAAIRVAAAFDLLRTLHSTVAAYRRSHSDHGPDGNPQLMADRPLANDAAPRGQLTSARWQVTVEDVRGGFPLAADLPPDDHVLAGVGLLSAVGRNRKTIRPTIERHVT